MFKIYFNTAKSKRIEKIRKIRNGAWVDVSNAEHDDLEQVAKLANLNLTDLQDTLDLQELPRIERHKKTLMVFVRTVKEDIGVPDFIDTVPLAIIITDNYFFTISPLKTSVIKDTIKSKASLATTQRGKLLVYLLLKIAQQYTARIKSISYEVASKKKDIQNIKNSDIASLIRYEDRLNQYISALIPMRNVFENILNGAYINFYQEDQELFDDLTISIRQSVDICQVNLKSIKSLRESYQIVFTNRLNKVIQFLTSFTIIMTIPTIVASVYGMNVDLPLSHSPMAFWYILLISFSLITLFLIIFHKKKWL